MRRFKRNSELLVCSQSACKNLHSSRRKTEICTRTNRTLTLPVLFTSPYTSIPVIPEVTDPAPELLNIHTGSHVCRRSCLRQGDTEQLIQWALQQSALIPADVLRSTPCSNDLRDMHMPYWTQQPVCHCARVLISTLQQMWDTPT